MRTITMSAERVDGSTPGVRVTWNTTVPPECVASVTVEFRTINSGSIAVKSYTTTNTSKTEVIQTGLKCDTTYNIKVTVITEVDASRNATLSKQIQVLVRGKVTACVVSSCYDQMSLSCLGAWWYVEHC